MRPTYLARATAGALLMSLLVGCNWMTGSPLEATTVLNGTVELSALYPRSTQASFDQVADSSTISLMETTGATSTTIASTVTKAGGSFSLAIPRFTADPAKTYVLEAVKGLYGNAVNRDAARVRTLLQFRDGAWVSLTNLIPGPINLGLGTTALCIMYGLRSGSETINPNDLMGSIAAGTAEPSPLPATLDTFTPPTALAAILTKAHFHMVSDLVYRAILGDSDPVSAVQYSTADGYFVKTASDPFIDNLSATAAGYGAPLALIGYRFDPAPANNTVYFGGATGSIAVIDTTKPNSANVLHVTVPEGAPSGLVMVRSGMGLSNGVQFTVLGRISGKLN